MGRSRADEPEAAGQEEFVVQAVVRRRWFSSEVLIAARRDFSHVTDGGRRYGLTVPFPFDCKIDIAEGDTFRLLLPHRLAEPGQLIAFDEIEENPAFDTLWVSVPRGGS